MNSPDLISLLECPGTRRPLVLNEEEAVIQGINEQISSGRLVHSSGERPSRPVDAILRAAGEGPTYPIVDGVLFLLEELALVASDERKIHAKPSSAMVELQGHQMEKYSRLYEDSTGGEDGIIRALQKQLHDRFHALLSGASVLDVGNGGTPPHVQLGHELSDSLSQFIALDRSFHMLTRSQFNGHKILGDAHRLPFKSDSVDFVMINNALHHFGLERSENALEKMESFMTEALRVCRKGVIGVDPVVPGIVEMVEHLVVKCWGFLPTLVYSENFFRRSFKEQRLKVINFESEKLRNLISPLKIIPPIIDLQWFKLPVFLVPMSFLFFAVEK